MIIYSKIIALIMGRGEWKKEETWEEKRKKVKMRRKRVEKRSIRANKRENILILFPPFYIHTYALMTAKKKSVKKTGKNLKILKGPPQGYILWPTR